MSESIFELMVIFFGLINSLANFQAMINDLLRDMIEAGDIAVFIDIIIVRMKTKKEHDDIVEEVLRRIVENNLFVKPEKCVWKNRQVRFLKVVIRLDKVKMKKKKVQGVVD